MSRRNAAEKRPVLPDPQFNSRLATMMVSRLMQHGKKSTAQRILSDAFGLINERTGGDPLELFETAQRLFEWDGYASIGIDHFARPNDALAVAAAHG